jgi:hypothetical protein
MPRKSKPTAQANPVIKTEGKPVGDVGVAFEAALFPVIEWAVNNGMTYQQCDEHVRRLMLRAVQATGAATTSEMHLRTGLARREIKRLIAEPDTPPPQSPSVLTKVCAAWNGRIDLLNKRGRPIALPRLRSAGGERSFEALVEGITRTVRPRAVLDSLIEQGFATIADNDHVRLIWAFSKQTKARSTLTQSESIAGYLGHVARVTVDNQLGRHNVPMPIAHGSALKATSAEALYKQWWPVMTDLLTQFNADIARKEAEDALTQGEATNSLQLSILFTANPLLKNMKLPNCGQS